MVPAYDKPEHRRHGVERGQLTHEDVSERAERLRESTPASITSIRTRNLRGGKGVVPGDPARLPVVFVFAQMNLLHYQAKFPAHGTRLVTVSYRQYAFADTRGRAATSWPTCCIWHALEGFRTDPSDAQRARRRGLQDFGSRRTGGEQRRK